MRMQDESRPLGAPTVTGTRSGISPPSAILELLPRTALLWTPGATCDNVHAGLDDVQEQFTGQMVTITPIAGDWPHVHCPVLQATDRFVRSTDGL